MDGLDKIGIRVAPLSGRVVLARFGKDPNVALETREATNDFFGSLVEYVGVGNELRFSGGGESYVLTLKRDESHPTPTEEETGK